jgi:plasmid stabilization system protein ParE
VKCKVVVSPAAAAEFKELHAYVKQRFGNRPAALLKSSFKTLLTSLRSHPYQGRAIPQRPGIRKSVIQSLTIVYYGFEGGIVTIHRVRDGREARN